MTEEQLIRINALAGRISQLRSFTEMGYTGVMTIVKNEVEDKSRILQQARLECDNILRERIERLLRERINELEKEWNEL